MIWRVLATSTLDLGEFDRALRGGDWIERMLVNPKFWLFIALCAAVALLMASLVRHIQRDRQRLLPTFRRVAGQLNLTLAQQRLLEEMAGQIGCQNVTPLLLSRGWFDHAVDRFPHRNARRGEIESIRARIFS